MSYVLGIDLGTSRTAAAVCRDGHAETVPLSDHAATMPSMVFVRDDQSLLVGEAARRRGPDDPTRLAREFKRRFGDTAPFVLGPTTMTAEQLTATLLRHVVAFVTTREGGPPHAVVVAHPANWGTYRRKLLRTEVSNAGLPTAQLISEPDAAAVHYASGQRMAVGDVIAVYDLGGGTFDATVLRRTANGFQQVGEPKGIERLGGIDFDEAMFQHVLQAAEIDTSSLGDADLPALLRLRDDCRQAKETLSDDDRATVNVNVGGVNRSVVVRRSEFEQMIRPSITDSVHCVRTAIVDSGVPIEQVSAVLMVGGSSRIPLARHLLQTELGRPVVLISHPKESVALGAARIGAGVAGTAPAGATAPAVPAVPPVAPPVPPVAPPVAPPAAPPAAAPVAPPVAAPPPPITVPAAHLPTVPTTVVPDAAPPSPRAGRRTALILLGALLAIALGVGAAIAIAGTGESSADTTVDGNADGNTTVDTSASTALSSTTSTSVLDTTTSQPPETTATTVVETTPPTTVPARGFDLYVVVDTFNFVGVPEALTPPASQSDPIPDGTYFGIVETDGGGNLVMSLDEVLMGATCVVVAEESGRECNPFIVNIVGYRVPVDPSAFIAVNNGSPTENLRIDAPELINLLNGDPPAPEAPAELAFANVFFVRVEGGVVVTVEGFFTP
jgi:actin-like ATPase involved in cell morphogenesis